MENEYTNKNVKTRTKNCRDKKWLKWHYVKFERGSGEKRSTEVKLNKNNAMGCGNVVKIYTKKENLLSSTG